MDDAEAEVTEETDEWECPNVWEYNSDAANDMPPPTQEGENVQYSGTEAVRERRAKRLRAFGEKQEMGEQMRKRIMKLRKQIKKDKPTVRGQQGENGKRE